MTTRSHSPTRHPHELELNRDPVVEADSVPLVAGRVAEKSNDDAIAENVVDERSSNAEKRRMIGLVGAAVRMAPVP